MVLLYTTLSDSAESVRIADSLLKSKLAACVDTWPIRSKYRWQGRIEDADEIVMIIKTTESAYRECMDHLLSEHPYEVPCVLRMTPESLVQEYTDWLEQETE
jgi:periplasmic divalent cation tolerance protein